eukprot:EG_transcript_7638
MPSVSRPASPPPRPAVPPASEAWQMPTASRAAPPTATLQFSLGESVARPPAPAPLPPRDAHLWPHPAEAHRTPRSIQWLSDSPTATSSQESAAEVRDSARLPPWEAPDSIPDPRGGDVANNSLLSTSREQLSLSAPVIFVQGASLPPSRVVQRGGYIASPRSAGDLYGEVDPFTIPLDDTTTISSPRPPLVPYAYLLPPRVEVAHAVPPPAASPPPPAAAGADPPASPLLQLLHTCRHHTAEIAGTQAALHREWAGGAPTPAVPAGPAAGDVVAQMRALEDALCTLRHMGADTLRLSTAARKAQSTTEAKVQELEAALKTSQLRCDELQAANAYLMEELEALQANDYHHSGKRRAQKDKSLLLTPAADPFRKLMTSKHLVKFNSVGIAQPEHPDGCWIGDVHKSRSGQGVCVILHPPETAEPPQPATPPSGTLLGHTGSGAKNRSRSYQPYQGTQTLRDVTNTPGTETVEEY